MRSKRGGSAVFLSVILAALMSVVLALIYSVREESVRSRVDGIVNLAGDSLLSEFHYELQKEYGLFLLKGTDEDLAGKLKQYIGYSLQDMEYVATDSVKVSGSGFSATDPELIRDQILDHMKTTGAGALPGDEDGQDSGTEAGAESSADTETAEAGRVLRHGPTIVSLPSAQTPSASLLSLAASIGERSANVEQVFRSGTEQYLLNQYILQHFNSRNQRTAEEHFFRNEAEYILAGELSDESNGEKVEAALKALRFPLNLAHIYADPEKHGAVAAMAQLMTPGAAAAATQTALASTWAYAEADNDAELLLQGYEVPLIKDSASWAIDLDSAAEGLLGGTARPSVSKGYDYGQYLQILLFFQDEHVKLARIMDLIQINMRKNSDEDFYIQEYSAGIAVDVTAGGRKYGYEKKY